MKKILPIIILITFIVATYLYFGIEFPDEMASHWNQYGEVDGYMSKFWSLYLMPVITLVIYLIFLLVPKIDPLKRNIEKFRKYFDRFILLIVLFLIYIYILTILWNLGVSYSMTGAIIPGIVVLLLFAGDLTKKSKRNWFIGIRTPWTLSSDEVWEKTNKLGGNLIQASAALSCLGIIFPNLFVWFLLIPLLASTTITLIYSYFIFRNLS